MKLLQIHSFYEEYVNHFYSSRPGLDHKPSREQLLTLLDDGFAGSHMFAAELQKRGEEAMLVIANIAPIQKAWARENDLSVLADTNNLSAISLAQVELFRPDVLYLSHPIDFDSRFVRALSFKPKLVMGWRAASIPSHVDLSEFDVILGHDSFHKELALKHGAKSVRYFAPGFPEWIAERLKNVTRKYEVVFSGQWGKEHTSRNAAIERVVAESKRDPKFSVGLFMLGDKSSMPAEVAALNQGARWAYDMHVALREGGITLNGTLDVQRGEAGNMRTFEATGSGSMLLTPYSDSIHRYFAPGLEVETYRGPEEMMEKIRYFNSHPDERERIAWRGQERCLREHGMNLRVLEFKEIVMEELAKPRGASTSPTTIVESNSDLSSEGGINKAIDTALSLLKEQKSLDALNLLIEAKKARIPVRDLDHVRALCFIGLERTAEAVEALKEELRYFPDNNAALELLTSTADTRDQNVNLDSADPEFRELLPKIRPYTMMPLSRMYNLYCIAKHVCQADVPGNFVECGVAAGGSSGMLAWIINKYSKRPRLLFSCDTFSGMPEPTEHDTHQGIGADETGWGTGTCAAPEESLMTLCRSLGVDHLVRPIKGFFEDTLAINKASMGEIAFLHLDADWYSSTMCILDNLYDQVNPNGLFQVDDYGHWEGCAKAIHEYENSHGIKYEIRNIDGAGVWFSKPQPSSSSRTSMR